MRDQGTRVTGDRAGDGIDWVATTKLMHPTWARFKAFRELIHDPGDEDRS